MKHLIAMVLLLMSFQATAETIKVGYFLMPPFIFEKEPGSGSQNLTGVVIDYFDTYLAPKMDVTLEWLGPFSIPRLTKYLVTGEIHLTPMLSKTKQREQQTQFAEEAFIAFPSGIVFRQDHPLSKIKSSQQLFNSTLAYFLGSPLPAFLLNEKIEIIKVSHKNWALSNLTLVSRGRVDGAYFPNLFEPEYYIDQKKMPLKVLKLPLPNVVPFTVFSKKTPETVVQHFNRLNHQAIEQNIFNQYLKQYTK